MRKIILISLLTITTLSLFSLEKPSHGLVVSYYNEPSLKPGITLGLDTELNINSNHRIGLVFPTITYFYFPNNYHALYLYPELSYRFINNSGFYTGLSFGSGLSLSKKVVPVYNLNGDLTDTTWQRHLLLKSVLSFGYDLSIKKSLPYRIFFNIGWKGIYPDNLGVLNQGLLELGVRYTLPNFYRSKSK